MSFSTPPPGRFALGRGLEHLNTVTFPNRKRFKQESVTALEFSVRLYPNPPHSGQNRVDLETDPKATDSVVTERGP